MTTSKVKNYNKGYEITQPIDYVGSHDEEVDDEDWFDSLRSVQANKAKPKWGEFTLMFPWGPTQIMAGPYRDKPPEIHGIKLAAEFADECAVSLPIKDYSVPLDRSAVDAALLTTLHLIRMGKPIYVGCYGGMGRTGLFLALLAKVAIQTEQKWWSFSPDDPITLIREIYRPEAVETKMQEDYVRNFNVRPVAKVVKRWGR